MLDRVHHFFVFFFSILCRPKAPDLRQHLRVSTPSIPGGCVMHLGLRSLSTQQERPPGEVRSISILATRVQSWDLDGDAAKCRCTASVWLARSHSHGELGSSAAAVGQQQQSPQTQPREWIAPQQRGRASEHRLHAVPPQATLPRGLLVFETFDFLRGIGMAPSTESFKQKYVRKTKQSNTERFCPTILN